MINILSLLLADDGNQIFSDWIFGVDGAGWVFGFISIIALIIVIIKRNKNNPKIAAESLKTTQVYIINDTDKVQLPETGYKNEFKAQTKLEQLNENTVTLKGFDAFLSYNREDQLDVKTIYEYLNEFGLKVWVDFESIKPGDDWLEGMQDGLENSKTCLVFFRNEPGVWQKEETKAAMRKKAENSAFKIIPVLLPGGKETDPSLPSLLTGTAWVDLRAGLFNMPALKKLIETIRGNDLVSIYPISEEQEIFNELPGGYKADVKKIISLLIGDALYSRRDIAIRELIQNALDACERRGNSRFGANATAEVIIKINTKEGYFEIRDNGDGMSPKFLSEYFAVIGKSVRNEENIIERLQGDEKTRTYLIGKFGIGFISTYMLAKNILISTTYEGFEQINLEIKGISEPFVYHNSSKLGRRPEEIGTSVRVYLKDTFLPQGSINLDVSAVVQEFCRHTPYVKMIKDGSSSLIKDNWNIDEAKIYDVTKVPFKFELQLGLSGSNFDFYASNAGFLINRISDAISPELMPTTIGGEINFYPDVVDLNMARDTIITNDKSRQIKGFVSKAIRNLLIKAVFNNKDEKVRKEITGILVAYLQQALKYEEKIQSNNTDLPNPKIHHTIDSAELEAPPLSSIEAAELLVDTLLVEMDDKELPLREALKILKESGKYRLYYTYWFGSQPLLELIQSILQSRGLPFIKLAINDIQFKSGKKETTYSLKALEYLSERYYFDIHKADNALKEDVEDLIISNDILSPIMKMVLGEIEISTGQQIQLSGLLGAPVSFELAGKKYLNVKHELFTKLTSAFENQDETVLKSYILGLLQYEIS